jgi:hypothetical protein
MLNVKRLNLVLLLCLLFAALTTIQAQTALNMFNAKHGNTLLDSWIYLDEKNNFMGASFASVDELSGYEDTIVVPAGGWTDKIAAVPGTEILAYLKGVCYRIYVAEYIVHSNETVKTTGNWFEYTTESRRSKEILGVRIEYRKPVNVKTEQAARTDTRKPSVFIAYGENLMLNKIKTKLLNKGCTFTQNAPQSDFQLYIKATERQFNSDRDFVYCYVDVTLELFDTSTGESVYVDDFSQKGVSTSRNRAVRAAVEDAAETINEKITPYILK